MREIDAMSPRSRDIENCIIVPLCSSMEGLFRHSPRSNAKLGGRYIFEVKRTVYCASTSDT